MLAALQAPLSFANRSSVRTLLFGSSAQVMDAFRAPDARGAARGRHREDMPMTVRLFRPMAMEQRTVALGNPEQTLTRNVSLRCSNGASTACRPTLHVSSRCRDHGDGDGEICAAVGITRPIAW